MGTPEVRPAFYALERGGWRDYVTLLHPPYTLWHLSFVAVGAALAPQFHLDRLVWALVAFFLALGIAAHALDELKGRPLRTRIPSRMLVAIAVVSLALACAVGVGAAYAWGWWLLVFVVAGAVLVPAYNLELALHTRLGLRARMGRIPRADGLLRRSADPARRGRCDRRLRVRLEPGATNALDTRPPRAPRARHDRGRRDARARVEAAHVDVGRTRGRPGRRAPTMSP